MMKLSLSKIGLLLVAAFMLGLLARVGPFAAGVAYSQGLSDCGAVTDSVYASVSNTATGSTLCTISGEMMIADSGQYDITVHAPVQFDGRTVVLAGLENVLDQNEIAGGAVTFPGVAAAAGDRLYWSVLPEQGEFSSTQLKTRSKHGAFGFDRASEPSGDLFLTEFPEAGPFDILLDMIDFQDGGTVRIVNETGAPITGSFTLEKGRAFIPNVELPGSGRMYAVAEGVTVEEGIYEKDAFFIGYVPQSCDFGICDDDIGYKLRLHDDGNGDADTQIVAMIPEDGYVRDTPADNVNYFFASVFSPSGPTLNAVLDIRYGSDRRSAGFYAECCGNSLLNHHMMRPDDWYSVTLKRASAEWGDLSGALAGQLVTGARHTQGNSVISIFQGLTDESGKVYFNEIQVDTFRIASTPLPPLAGGVSPAGAPVVQSGPLQPEGGGGLVAIEPGFAYELPVVPLGKPGKQPSAPFDLSDLAWFASRAPSFDFNQDGSHDGFDIGLLLDILLPFDL
jgi:hypothetical protein